MTTLFAQPYDLSATGFYFESLDDYQLKSQALRNTYGQPVEEYEIQFIDGDDIDAALAKAWDLSQCNLAGFFRCVEEFSLDEKQCFIIAVGECGYSFDPDKVSGNEFEVTIYGCETLTELAREFVEEGMYGEVNENLQWYLDYDAIALDLAFDYTETIIAGTRLIYACP